MSLTHLSGVIVVSLSFDFNDGIFSYQTRKDSFTRNELLIIQLKTKKEDIPIIPSVQT